MKKNCHISLLKKQGFSYNKNMRVCKKLCFVLLFFIIISPSFAFEKLFDFSDEMNEDKRLELTYAYTLHHTRKHSASDDQAATPVVKEESEESEEPQLAPYHITLTINTDTQKITYDVKLQSGEKELFWYPHLIGNIISVYMEFDDKIYETADFSISMKMDYIEQDQVYNHSVITASLEDMLQWKPLSGTQEDFYIFRWQSYPDVLILSFESRAIQAKYLKRLAFFTEKTHTRGEVQYLRDITHRQGWGAHDYKISDMVRFYNEVSKKQLDDNLYASLLNEEEVYLRSVLIDLHVIRMHDDNFENAGLRYSINNDYADGAVVSYARSDRKGLQRTLLFHELLHTIFFRDKIMQEKLDQVWDDFSPKNKKIWKAFMLRNGYDPNFDYLMKNELFAYLLQRPIQDLSWYIPSRILAEAIPYIKDEKITEADKQTFIQILTNTAYELSDYLHTHYFLYDGNVQYVNIVKKS